MTNYGLKNSFVSRNAHVTYRIVDVMYWFQFTSPGVPMTLKFSSLFYLTFSMYYGFIFKNILLIVILFFLLLFNLIYSAFCYLQLFLRKYVCLFIFRVCSTFSSDIVVLWIKIKYMYVWKKWNKPDCSGCRCVLLRWSSGSGTPLNISTHEILFVFSFTFHW